MMNYFRNKLSDYIKFIVKNEVDRILSNKLVTEYSVNEKFSEIASFDKKEVRFEITSNITNNRGHKDYIKIGDNSWIQGELQTLKHGGEIIIGNDCFIGKDSRIWSSVKITIGNRVLISHNVNIHDNNSHPLNASDRHKDFLHVRKIGLQDVMQINEKEIILGDDVWVGFNSTILKGVTIGTGAIIGANTIVTRDVPAYAVVIGNPAKIIKYTN